MAAVDFERMQVSMEAQFSRYEKALARVERLTGTTTTRIQARVTDMEKSLATRVGATLSGLGAMTGIGTILGGLSLAGIIEQLRSVSEQFAGIADVADRTGLGSEQVQELRYAAEMAGGSVESLDSGIVRFSKGISDAARGSGDLEKVLRANGVALNGVDGKARATLDVLYDYADLVKNAKNPQDALNLATMAFGRSAGPALVVALRDGADGLRQAGVEARNFGAVADEALIRKAAKIDDAFVRLARSIKVQAGGALIEGADAVRTYQNAIIGLAAAIGAVGAGALLGPLASSLAAATAGATVAAVRMNVLNGSILAVAAGQRVAALATAGLSTALSLLGGPWGIAITALVGSIAYLALRTDDAKKSTEQHEAAVRDFSEAVALVKTGVPGAIDRVRELGKEHVEGAKKALAAAEAEYEYAKSVAAQRPLSGALGKYGGGAKTPVQGMAGVSDAVDQRLADIAAKRKELQEWEARVASAVSGSTTAGTTTIPDSNADSNAQQFARAMEQSRQRVASLQLEASLVGKSTMEAVKARVAQDLLTSAKEADIPVTAKLAAEIDRRAAAEASATVALDAARESQAQWNNLQQEVGDFAVDNLAALAAGYQDLNGVLKNGIGLITQMILKSALLGEGPLAGLFGGRATSNGPGGLIGSLFGAFGGFRAGGGPVQAGKSYIVGERGPEVATFGRSGFVTPNTALAPRSSGGVTFAPSTTIDARGSNMSEAQIKGLLDQRDREILRQVPGVVNASRARTPSYQRV